MRKPWRDPRQDLAAARAAAKTAVGALAAALAGGPEALGRRRRLSKLAQGRAWGSKADRHFLSREQLYKRGLAAAIGIRELVLSEGLSFEDAKILRKLVDLPGGFELHFGMFIPTLMGQGTAEQLEKWLQPALECKIIGTYAQTEMGHGTFLRGLETTASFDPQSDEFVVNSPTPTATKWWPGGLGKTATHAVVMARLFLDGKDHGPHPFVMQLRDLGTHRALPGVTVGDIGPKLGYNGVDNGFLRFDHVRIPRSALLQKYAKVTRDGRYLPPPKSNAKSSYATMVFVRADIVKGAGDVLSKAATIAVRYNAIRRQTTHVPGQPEEIILNYQQSARNLLPMIAQSYAVHFMGESMMDFYNEFEADRNAGNFARLPELHAMSSCLKAVCTWATSRGIETCRQACGGQGYSALSGLPALYANYVQNITWEGDNVILSLQAARYLMKTLLGVVRPDGRAAPLAESVAYLAEAGRPIAPVAARSVGELASFATLDALMGRRSRFLAQAALADLEANARRLGGGAVAFEGPVWSASHVSQVRAAVAHGWFLLHRSFFAKVEHAPELAALPEGTRRTLLDLASLFTLTHVEDHLGDFLEAGVLTPAQAPLVHAAVNDLLSKVRPEAVALVDAFAHDDYALNSAIGTASGDVYTNLIKMAKVNNPFNQTEEGPAWHDILGPFMQSHGTSKL